MENKIKYIISLAIASPFLVKAQFIEEETSKEAVLPKNFAGANATITGATNVINILLLIIIIASFLGLLISLTLFITAGGNENSLEKGRKTALSSLVGFCVGLVGYIIFKIIKYLFLI